MRVNNIFARLITHVINFLERNAVIMFPIAALVLVGMLGGVIALGAISAPIAIIVATAVPLVGVSLGLSVALYRSFTRPGGLLRSLFGIQQDSDDQFSQAQQLSATTVDRPQLSSMASLIENMERKIIEIEMQYKDDREQVKQLKQEYEEFNLNLKAMNQEIDLRLAQTQIRLKLLNGQVFLDNKQQTEESKIERGVSP